MANLIIVDDDPDYAETLADLLAAEDHQVRVGFDGTEGLRLAQQQTPDLALLDVEMPVLGGPGLVVKMFLHDMGLENVPVVLLSGVSNLREIARRAGTPYFLGKPYRFEQVLALVNRALDERAAPRPTV